MWGRPPGLPALHLARARGGLDHKHLDRTTPRLDLQTKLFFESRKN
jgi:hypothetical protein